VQTEQPTVTSPVTDEQVRSFVDDGFLVAPDLVSPGELEEIKADAMRFARGEYKTENPPEVTPGLRAPSEADAMEGVLAVHFPHWVSPIMRSFITHPGVAGVVQRVAGAHLPHWDGAAKCMQSMLFVKPAGLPGQAWHQDERFIPTRDRSLVGAWIAIDDATIKNGCLWVLPGSHRTGYIWPSRPHGNPDEFDPTDESFGFDDAAAVPVEVKAGSVVFFNGYLLHRSLKNRSQGYRRSLVNHYCNAWSLLPWTVGPQDISTYQVPTLDFRNVIPIGPDPYESKGYDTPPDQVFIRPHIAH
jgi:ectoine hydroxylase-related dioxygenase (phytanoyl-CoA dioxygenase family)